MFTSTMYDNPASPFFKETGVIAVLVRNLNVNQDVTVRLLTLGCLSDDFATGIFLGMPPLRKVPSTEQSGVVDYMEKAIDNTLPVVEAVGDLMNLLDAHPVTLQPAPVRSKMMGHTIACNEVQYLERLSVTNHGMSLADKDAFYTKEKETDIYQIMQNVKSLVAIIPWSTSNKQGELLQAFTIGPFMNQQLFYNPHPIDSIAEDFVFWNGSLIYIFDISASKMHKGQLTLTFHPNLVTPPETLDQATQQYFTSFDLNEGRGIIAVQLPYLQKKDYLPIVDSNVKAFSNSDCANGIFCLWVQNALRGTPTVCNYVDINVYMVAGKDFKLDVYGSTRYAALNSNKILTTPLTQKSIASTPKAISSKRKTPANSS